jgi:hypothetical protein
MRIFDGNGASRELRNMLPRVSRVTQSFGKRPEITPRRIKLLPTAVDEERIFEVSEARARGATVGGGM